MAKAANPAFVQEFTLFKPRSDAIPAKVHHFCPFLPFVHWNGFNSCSFAAISAAAETS